MASTQAARVLATRRRLESRRAEAFILLAVSPKGLQAGAEIAAEWPSRPPLEARPWRCLEKPAAPWGYPGLGLAEARATPPRRPGSGRRAEAVDHLDACPLQSRDNQACVGIQPDGCFNLIGEAPTRAGAPDETPTTCSIPRPWPCLLGDSPESQAPLGWKEGRTSTSCSRSPRALPPEPPFIMCPRSGRRRPLRHRRRTGRLEIWSWRPPGFLVQDQVVSQAKAGGHLDDRPPTAEQRPEASQRAGCRRCFDCRQFVAVSRSPRAGPALDGPRRADRPRPIYASTKMKPSAALGISSPEHGKSRAWCLHRPTELHPRRPLESLASHRGHRSGLLAEVLDQVDYLFEDLTNHEWRRGATQGCSTCPVTAGMGRFFEALLFSACWPLAPRWPAGSLDLDEQTAGHRAPWFGMIMGQLAWTSIRRSGQRLDVGGGWAATFRRGRPCASSP